MALVAIVGAAIFVPRLTGAPAPLVLVLAALAQVAALLLISRALVPAAARRSSWTVSASLAVVVLLTAIHTLTFFSAFTLPALAGKGDALFLGTLLVLAAVLLVIPRPLATTPSFGWWPGLAPVGAIAALAFAGAALRRPAPPSAAATTTPVVATWNLHYGFGEDWRFDPEMVARAIEASGADVIALQEVPAGLLAMYGVDLSAWLGHRLGMRDYFAPSIDGQLGDAILTRLPASGFESIVLPPESGDLKRLVKVVVDAGGTRVPVYAAHFGLTDEERARQAQAVVAAIEPGPAIFAGDLNAEEGGAVIAALEAAGFADAFSLAGVAGAPTWPAIVPEVRIDWIRVRGFGATSAAVSGAGGSDHRLVSATIAIPGS
jgi:endonuclease/exonuclease/phosphatase family metal-dependent hydrolase